MNFRLAALFAVLLAIAFAAAGYSIGTRHNAVDRVAVESIVQDAIAKSKPAVSVPASMAPGQPAQMAELSDDQRRDVEATIRNYLIANPEIVRDAIDALQQKEDAAAQVAQTATIKDNSDELFNSKREVVLGNPKGDVTLVEFFDYNCAYCRHAHADMLQLLKNDPNLRIVLKEFPILGDGSVQAAQVAVAVLLTAPDKYLDFHDELITTPGPVDGAKALAVAADVGLDQDKIKTVAASDEVKANLNEVRDLATKLDLTGTPSYATKLKVVVGAVGYDQLAQEIQAVRDCSKVASC
ncbi:MAG TPA: DsbA family protein [Bauldia sp.]|nr:DsbA family protein [Bauldia sp.]